MIEKKRNICIKLGIYITAIGLCLVSSTGCQSNQPPSATIGEENALTSALVHAQLKQDDITNLSIGLEHENGSKVYDIDFICNGYEYDYDINAVTGEVVKYEKALDNNLTPSQESITENPSSVSKASYIGEDKAKAAAFSHAGVVENNIYNYRCKLDYDDGITHYEIDFDCDGYEYEYEIDAADGSVLKHQKEIENKFSQQSALSDSSSSNIGEAQAKAAALSHAGISESNIYNYRCKLDRDGGILHYEIDFDCNGYEYEYKIDITNGSVLEYQKEKDDDIPSLQTNTGNSSSTYIGEAEAKTIALSHAGVAETNIHKYKCELDYDNGYTYYEIEFETGNYEYEYEIDAYSGTILKNEKDWDS
jgi:uncharacterized membrane protein YkoI